MTQTGGHAVNQDAETQVVEQREFSAAHCRIYINRGAIEIDIDAMRNDKTLARTSSTIRRDVDAQRLMRWLYHEYAALAQRMETRLYRGDFRQEAG
jgi:hypothetical protein